MRHLLLKATVLGALAIPLVMPSELFAARTAADLLRTQVLRLHGRLTRDALESPEIAEARAASARAFATLYQVRENILADVRKREAYVDLRMALWHQQQILAGQHQEVPVRIQKILASATDSMSIRSQIGRIEAEALDASDAYLAAREELNALLAAERQLVNGALDNVRNDPQFVALTQQLRSAQKLHSGRNVGRR